MTNKRTEFEMEQINGMLLSEFERYVMEHLQWAEQIPKGAQVIFLVEGDDEFNQWSKERGSAQVEDGQPVMYVKIKGLEPVRSRIKGLEVAQVA
jgi:hypothetical protein